MKSLLGDESFGFWKKIIFVAVFFTITPIALFSSALSLISLGKTPTPKESVTVPNLIQVPKSGVQVYASLPSSFPSVSGEVLVADARAQLIRQYLTDYSSPLIPQADFIVKTSDKYGLDFRLTTAIAQKESNLCKKAPPESFNCWGWGIHSQGTLTFPSYEDAIEAVSKGLKEQYIDKGFITIEEIMSKYTPLSQGTWADGVTMFMDEIK